MHMQMLSPTQHCSSAAHACRMNVAVLISCQRPQQRLHESIADVRFAAECRARATCAWPHLSIEGKLRRQVSEGVQSRQRPACSYVPDFIHHLKHLQKSPLGDQQRGSFQGSYHQRCHLRMTSSAVHQCMLCFLQQDNMSCSREAHAIL